MKYLYLVKANMRSKKSTFIGVGILIFIITVCLCAVINIFVNASTFEDRELDRIGYGDITYWVADTFDVEQIKSQVESLYDVEEVKLQQELFVTYSVNGIKNDSSAFGIAYEEGAQAYHIFTDDLRGINTSPSAPKEGDVYVPASFRGLYQAEIGDDVAIHITGEADARYYRISGYFEDPVAGSSMMGMKSILMNQKDLISLKELFQTDAALGAGIYAVHITQKADSPLSGGGFQRLLNEQTDITQYASFAYQKAAISGFMLLIGEIISGILLVFILVLLIVALIVIGRSITSAIEEDYVDMGILKAVGYTKRALRRVQLLQYAIIILIGMILGLPVSVNLARLMNRLMITVNGIMLTNRLPVVFTLTALGIILLLFSAFIILGTVKIGRITPIHAIRGGADDIYFKDRFAVGIHKRGLEFWLALRQLISTKKQYISACLVAACLVFFLSIMGRIGAWIGSDGRGLMNALNVTTYDLGVHYDNSEIQREAEEKMLTRTDITDTFTLRMTKGTLNNMEYVLYSISDPEYYHMLSGRTCKYANEIVITDFVAKDLNVTIGDTVEVGYFDNAGTFLISGIYQCANDVGANFGMNMEGYASIGGNTGGDNTNKAGIFQYYLFEDSGKADEIAAWLSNRYGEDILLDQNEWSGLENILDVLSALNILEYIVSLFFIIIVAFMTGHRIIYRERRDLGIYKSLGFSSGWLRQSFALRFALVTAIGACLGVMGSAFFTDTLASGILRFAGISRITSHLDFLSMMIPAIIITVLFYVFAWLCAGRIKKTGAEVLIVE